MTNREHIIELLTELLQVKDATSEKYEEYEKWLYLYLICPHTTDDDRRMCKELGFHYTQLCTKCKNKWLDSEVEDLRAKEIKNE